MPTPQPGLTPRKTETMSSTARKTQAQIDRMVENGDMTSTATNTAAIEDTTPTDQERINAALDASDMAYNGQTSTAQDNRPITRAEKSARNRAEFARQAAEQAQARYLAALDELQRIEQDTLRTWALEQARKAQDKQGK